MASGSPKDDTQQVSASVEMPHADAAGAVPSLPLETRWPPFLLRRYAGFWLPEVALKSGLPAVHSVFKPRPTDVFLASPTWLKALAFATLKRSSHPPLAGDHPLRHCNPHDCVRFLESKINADKWDDFEALPSPRVLATHLPYTLLPDGIITGNDDGGSAPDAGCRIVYICREPKDALVSSWLFTKKVSPAVGVDAGSFTMEEAFELFCEGRCMYGPQWQHALEYWEESARRPDKVLFLRYEEMLLDPERHVKKLAKFMGCGFSDQEEKQGVLSAIVELCSLRKLKDMEVNRNGSNHLGLKNESFFRKGVAGNWSNHLTLDMAQRLNKRVFGSEDGMGRDGTVPSGSSVWFGVTGDGDVPNGEYSPKMRDEPVRPKRADGVVPFQRRVSPSV